MREYKKSLIRYSAMHAPKMNLRYRGQSKKNVDPVIDASRPKRQTVNPYKTEVGSSHKYERKLKAAAVCSKHGIKRMVPICKLEKYRHNLNAKLACKLCSFRGIHQFTTWACISCGAELCIFPRYGNNRYPNLISCADAAHQQDKINISDLTVKK